MYLNYLLQHVLPHVQIVFPLPCEKVFDVVLSGPFPLVVVTVVTLFVGDKQLLFLESIILTVATLFPALQLLFVGIKLKLPLGFEKLELLFSPQMLQDFVQSPITFPNLLIILQIIHVNTAVTYAKILYNIAYISKVPLGAITKATIKNIAKKVAPTSKGKKTNNTFIFYLSIAFYTFTSYYLYFYYILCNLVSFCYINLYIIYV